MITKERLKELIEQDAVIYDIFQGDIYLVDLTMINNLGDVGIEYYNDYYHCNLCRNTDDLFENREDAEWHLEFGNVTRTERLKLPTWNEINNILQNQYCFELEFNTKFERIRLCVDDCQIAVIHYHKDYLSGSDGPFNRENYIRACRETKELFLGEK